MCGGSTCQATGKEAKKGTRRHEIKSKSGKQDGGKAVGEESASLWRERRAGAGNVAGQTNEGRGCSAQAVKASAEVKGEEEGKHASAFHTLLAMG